MIENLSAVLISSFSHARRVLDHSISSYQSTFVTSESTLLYSIWPPSVCKLSLGYARTHTHTRTHTTTHATTQTPRRHQISYEPHTHTRDTRSHMSHTHTQDTHETPDHI